MQSWNVVLGDGIASHKERLIARHRDGGSSGPAWPAAMHQVLCSAPAAGQVGAGLMVLEHRKL